MRNPHFWFTAAVGLMAVAIVASLLGESLWLDELHTSWSVSGQWQQIADRAAAGNQTPLYFWLAAVVNRTFGGQPDWILRLPSVFAWFGAIALVGWNLGKLEGRKASNVCSVLPCWPISSQMVLCWPVLVRPVVTWPVLSWIVLDRLQWFYATEARPYALVQLVSIAGWCCIQSLQANSSQPEDPRRAPRLIAFWSLLSIANIYLHLTAALVVFCQFLLGAIFLWQSDRRKWLGWLIASSAVGVACLPILRLAFPVWQRREQWAAFASDVSLNRAIWMFPFVAVLVPVLIGVAVDQLWQRSHKPIVERVTAENSLSWANQGTRAIWWSATLLPWMLAWSITALGLAPMFHQRFVIASALPLMMVGGLELLRIQRDWFRYFVSAMVVIAIIVSQGTVTSWRSGQFVGALRNEDWRAATQWINKNIEPGEMLLCSSGLIEANAAALPLGQRFAEYLAFPLHGAYRVTDNTGQLLAVTPLVGDQRLWSTQIAERMAGQDFEAAVASTTNNQLSAWLIYRGAQTRLDVKLKTLIDDLTQRKIAAQPQPSKKFGNLYVVEIQIKLAKTERN